MKGTITHEIKNQAQAEYFEKWQKDLEKSLKKRRERVNELGFDWAKGGWIVEKEKELFGEVND